MGTYADIEEGVAQLLKVKELMKELTASKPGDAPAQPRVIENAEQYEAWATAYLSWLQQSDEHTKAWGEALAKLRGAEGFLIKSIPIKNTWFRAELDGKSWGVGKYTDAWGGMHSEIRLEEWRNPMPTLEDTLYYP